ncbi:MAG: DUF2892 domain-containing protein [Pararhodobacter sp.]|nr:DUF2892 domain-containing protein [Pararhodobacter sp.]
MLVRNVGTIDRAIRIIVGAALILSFFLFPDAGWRWLLLIGIVPLVTGIMQSCPAYRLFGISTCPAQRG